jgi:hypothetical protein
MAKVPSSPCTQAEIDDHTQDYSGGYDYAAPKQKIKQLHILLAMLISQRFDLLPNFSFIPLLVVVAVNRMSGERRNRNGNYENLRFIRTVTEPRVHVKRSSV